MGSALQFPRNQLLKGKGDLGWGAFILGEEATFSHKVIIQGLGFPSWEETAPPSELTGAEGRSLGVAGKPPALQPGLRNSTSVSHMKLYMFS